MVTIWVVSGEGEQGTRERYTGALTVRALEQRLAREQAGGDRWARIEVEGAGGDPKGWTVEDAIAAQERGVTELAREVSIRWPTLSAGAPLDSIIEQAARDLGRLPTATEVRDILREATEEHTQERGE